jgi:catechol 2,3-dioxygenase-like lactoylglutathione lyase family enzyme
MHPQTLPNESDERPGLAGHGSRPDALESRARVQKFSHLLVGVRDLDRSEAWYRDIIGLDLMGRDLTAEERPHSVFRMNTGQLVILVENTGFEPIPRCQIHHAFMLTANQYRRAAERLSALGYPVGDTHDGHRAVGEYSIDIADPDGHRYQLQTYGPEAFQVMTGEGVVDCGPADRYAAGDVRPFKAGNFFLVRHPEGFMAISKWCTHMNGVTVYQPHYWQFWCPFHDATYDRRGIPQPYPGNRAGGPLRVHPITFSADGRVLVDTNAIADDRAAVAPEGVR